MAAEQEYMARIRELDADGLIGLHASILAAHTPGWDAGIETIFFRHPFSLETHVGAALTEEIRVLTRFRCKEALALLHQRAGKAAPDTAETVALARAIGVDRLRQDSLVAAVLEFVTAGAVVSVPVS